MNLSSLDMNTNINLSDFMTPRWALIVLGLVIGGGVGLYEMFVGHILATTQVVVWTTPLVTYFFLALASTGISLLLAYGLLAGNNTIIDRTRYLLVLDLALLIGGFTALATELGSIFNMIYIMLSPNPSSPIWWMGNFYTVKLVLVAIKLLRELLGIHGTVDRPLAWATLVVAAAAAMTIGAALGTAIGRPDYQGVFTSLLMLGVALASGPAWVVLLRRDAELASHINGITRQLAGLVALFLLLNLIYDVRATTEGLVGWVNPIMPLLFAATAIAGGMVPRAAAALTLVGSFWVLFSFVITGQLWVLGANTSFFGEVSSFSPNLAEAGTIVLGLSVAAALYNLGRMFLLEHGNASPTAAAAAT
ncbi:MAG: polysulfide reductase [Gammaproteobacteria bacterium]|nr:polysulfide reductase [Gammaproteobacteria bacterium]